MILEPIVPNDYKYQTDTHYTLKTRSCLLAKEWLMVTRKNKGLPRLSIEIRHCFGQSMFLNNEDI